MSSEEVNEVQNEEATEKVANEIIETTNEEQPTEQIKEEEPKEETKPIAKAKAVPKKLARSVKVVEVVECGACNKKMLPKSLRNTHPYYCKGQPTETLPVNRQKASYGTKVEQKLRKEIEEEMKKKYEVVNHSETVEAKTKPKPSVPIVPSVPKQLTATELLQQSYNEMKRLRQQEKQEKINKFRASMF